MSTQLSSIADFIRYSYSRMNAAKLFYGHGTDNAWDESVALVLQTLKLPWDFARDMWSCALTEDEKQNILANLAERIENRTPLAYLTNQAYFCDLPFYVDDRVLVPRSPISELIKSGFEPWLTKEPARIMDLCTGSGCIGIACAMLFENAEVDLLDISPDALDVAMINVEDYSLGERVRIIESDCFSSLSKDDEKQYDLIVSNPPYVDAQDMADMPAEFRAEPELGLASGEDGLDFVRDMLKQAARFLAEDGVLIAEVGNSWVALEEAFPHVQFTWLEFEHGGHGVFMLTAEQLKDLAQ